MNTEIILDYIGRIIEACAGEILRYTLQLYEVQKDVDDYDPSEVVSPEPIASSVLLQIQGYYFLVTAGHVFDRKVKNNIGFMINNEIHFIMGQLRYSDVKQDETSNKVDLAILKLDPDVVQALNVKYKFINSELISFDHSIVNTPSYLIVGYPIRKTKVDKVKRKIIPSPLIFITGEADQSEYNRLKFDPLVNVLLKYRQKKVKNFTNKRVEQHTNPQGISGCGVWYIANFIKPEGGLPDFKLMGIIIEQNESKTILIATRIHILTEAIRKSFKIDVPRSKILRISED
ncbi:hypothetical protein LX87_05612 [Larkinella arboricola]|uniref:Trypsin-like peptidase n=1 Tax=Larkinella arboricola TaxID=643671 RepID=A0A327WJF0_LARAB|nr:hypothetical protein [Larkinella arboricola]RAJ89923.1 hypothetical protein LX87_05612 [Larkinella arboricola]